MTSPIRSSRLYRLANPADTGSPLPRATPPRLKSTVDSVEGERCQLCAQAIPIGHRHLLDLTERRLRCACRACCVLFDRATAGGQRYRLVPDRRWYLPDFMLDDVIWVGLGLPVEMAFFFHDNRAGRVVAFYPSPAGAVESLLDLASWRELALANPVLDSLQPDIEALLVNRAQGARDHWLVPIDDCYALAGLIRTHWSGLTGGTRVRDELAAFFATLHDRARTVRARRPDQTDTANTANTANTVEGSKA
ncbi:DUF5947 family protein [Rugosimonospora acidiphila]|uniref:DUF5947 family protein n=1 Tax=Rugosimonospora acidiphila TaxID=556531 RepID=A0ABP9SFT4_9ACTN